MDMIMWNCITGAQSRLICKRYFWPEGYAGSCKDPVNLLMNTQLLFPGEYALLTENPRLGDAKLYGNASGKTFSDEFPSFHAG